MAARTRSRYFVATGAAGGLLGFIVMEHLATAWGSGGSAGTQIHHMALYFGGFGLAVGACLGMTEGLVLRRPRKLVYGLLLGLALGALGGAAGGAVGQALFGLLPIRYATQSGVDIALVLDSSGSMRHLVFWGNDPWGKRKDAAKDLIDRLSDRDRVAVIDFDDTATLHLPLTVLDSKAARSGARQAVDRVDSRGGTDLGAGLRRAVEALGDTAGDGRPRFIIFLTDGIGAFDPGIVEAARNARITVYSIGLGPGVDANLLERAIAEPTGGTYFAVAHAGELSTVFQHIYSERISMAARPRDAAIVGAERLTGQGVLLGFRIVSWALMGLMIGLGQGVRENTREDLRACGIGGLVGGLLGGGLFEPVSSLSGLAGAVASRFLADVIVGAFIGGSMRLAQERLVDVLPRTTRLSELLPRKEELGALTHSRLDGIHGK